ncbi:E3 ubiquitin-protein ligase TRIM45-like [Glandiceps talaboti]
MASKELSVLEKVNENFLLCGICLERYKTPKLLPCLHSFCESCLVTLVEKRGGDMIICPTCRRSFQALENGVAGIPTDSFLHELTATFRKRDEGSADSEKCEGCQEGERVKHCVECGFDMCRICVASHGRFPLTRSHNLMTLEEFQSAKSDDPISVRPPLYCTYHPGNQLELFCDTCDKTVCTACIVLDHPRPDHTYRHLKEAATEYSKKFEEILRILEAKEIEAKKSQTSVKQVLEALDKCYQTEEHKLKDHVQKTIDEVIRLIQQSGDTLLRELKEEYDNRKMNLDAQLKELEGAKNDLSHTREYTNNVMHYGSVGQLMVAKKGISAQVDVLLNIETETEPIEDDYLKFLPFDDFCDARCVGEIQKHDVSYKLTTVPEFVRVGEDIKVTVATDTPQKTNRAIKIEAVLKKPDDSIDDVEMTKNNDNTWTLNTRGNICGKHELSVSVCKKAVNGSPACIDVIPQKGLIWQTGKSGSGLGELNYPYGIRSTRGGHLQVCDRGNHRLQTFTSKGQPNTIIKFSNISSTVTPVYSVQADNGDIFTTDIGSNQVIVHDENGHVMRSFGKGTMKCPYGIAISPLNGMVYVVDFNGHCIHIYNQDGNLYKTFGTQGQGQGQLYYPYDIKVDYDGKVFVSEHHNHRIQVFNSEGQYLYSFGSQGSGDGQMNNPTGLAIDSASNVYVCDCTNNRVLKFTSDGEFISRIDSDDNPCSSPRGVYVTDDKPLGNVVVVNYGNNCVQMFAQ